MKVTLQTHDGKERTFDGVDKVDDTDRYKVTLYDEDLNILAIVNKGDINNLFTESE